VRWRRRDKKIGANEESPLHKSVYKWQVGALARTITQVQKPGLSPYMLEFNKKEGGIGGY